MSTSWKSLSTGEKIYRAHALFWFALVLPICVIVIGYTAISSTLRSQAILEDHSIAQAVISADDETPATKRLARFTYTFEVDGKTYSKNFPVPQFRADDIEIGSKMPVAYANFDPNQSQREELLSGNADMKANLRSFATMSALTALLIGLFWMIITYLLKWRLASLFVD